MKLLINKMYKTNEGVIYKLTKIEPFKIIIRIKKGKGFHQLVALKEKNKWKVECCYVTRKFTSIVAIVNYYNNYNS